MRFIVSKITTDAQMDAIHQWCVDSAAGAFVCSAGIPYPSRNELMMYQRGPFTIYVAHEGQQCHGFLIADNTGRVLWLKHLPSTVGTVMRALLTTAQKDFPGALWGWVQNPAMRTALQAHGGAPHPEQGDTALVWVG